MRYIRSILSTKSVFIFDLDGTIIESVSRWNTIDSILCQELSIPLNNSEEIAYKRNQSIARNCNKENVYWEFCRELSEESPLPKSTIEVYERRKALSQEFPYHINLKPGILDFISVIRKMGKLIVLATNSRSSLLDSYCCASNGLKKLLSEHFDAIYTLESVTSCKPSPEIFTRIMEDFNCAPEQCVVFEDSNNGIVAARNANIDVVCVLSSSCIHAIPDETLHYITDYHDLIALISNNK